MAKKTPKQKTVTNKFYVGAARLSQGWAKPTLAEAIKHAEELLEEREQQGGEDYMGRPLPDHITVVKIVAVVRRKKAPVVVEKVD